MYESVEEIEILWRLNCWKDLKETPKEIRLKPVRIRIKVSLVFCAQLSGKSQRRQVGLLVCFHNPTSCVIISLALDKLFHLFNHMYLSQKMGTIPVLQNELRMMSNSTEDPIEPRNILLPQNVHLVNPPVLRAHTWLLASSTFPELSLCSCVINC